MAFATIPVLAEDGWSDDGMQSVVRVDPEQVQQWVSGLLQDQSEGRTAKVAYSPDQTTVDVFNDTDINGLAGAVSERLSAGGFLEGTIGNNENAKVAESQVQAAAADDPGAQAVATELGGLPVVVRPVDPRRHRARGAGRRLRRTGFRAGRHATHRRRACRTCPPRPTGRADSAALSPVITAGSDDPKCVN